VQLTYEITKQARNFATGPNGAFTFANALPGSYTITIAQPGFKTYEQKGVAVGAQESVDLHEIHFQMGDVSSTVEVQAEVARVATESFGPLGVCGPHDRREHAARGPRVSRHPADAAWHAGHRDK
jgi:hypothetical protein